MRMSSVVWIVIGWGLLATAAEDQTTLQYGSPSDVQMSGELLQRGAQLFRDAVERDELRGAVLLVARRGTIVLHEAIGWSNKETGEKMRRDTLFKMASNTKPVVATGILMLAEQGKLKLADNVRAHLPSWDNYRSGFIQVKHLLSHTSGLRIPVIFLRPLLARSEQNPDAPSLGAEVDRFGAIGAEVIPGTSYQYNNPGYQVLGRLIETSSGQPLAEFLRAHIYEPLGMKDAWNYEADAPQPRMARVYQRSGGKWRVRWTPGDGPDWPVVRGSGGMICSAADYAIFCQMYLNGGSYGDRRIVSQATVAEATAPHTASVFPPAERDRMESFYGYGWAVERNGVYGHGGSDGTQAWIDPARELVVLVFTQSPGGKNPRREFRQLVVDACQDGTAQRAADGQDSERPRLRDLGIRVGVLTTGKWNAITDVAGVRVGHRTLKSGDHIRTGVTAILPHGGNVFQDKVPAAIHVANGFGKFVGISQIEELGVLESPILLTNTLSTFAVANSAIAWTLRQPGNEQVRSVNPVVGECNDGFLNDIRGQHVADKDVRAALDDCRSGAIAEGCVGAGTGTRCLGWKGGIGTSSRQLPTNYGGFTVGVLVQTNFGGQLTVDGVPVGRQLGRFFLSDVAAPREHGSCIVVVATDAPLDSRQLKRLAKRATLGLGATGSPITHGSGDYVLAFSTAAANRQPYRATGPVQTPRLLRDERLSPLFQAVKDATEEAVINSMLQATTTEGFQGRRVEAIDPAAVQRVCREHGRVQEIP